jgi:DNA-binding NarL/FixJ family response regulator
VLLIDRTTLTRECLAHVFRTGIRELEVESVADLENAQTSAPQVVLLNIKAAGVSDTEVVNAVAALRNRYNTSTPLIVLGERDDPASAVEAIQHGLAGYIPVSVNTSVAIAAVRLVLAGGVFVPPSVVEVYSRRKRPSLEVDDGGAVMFLGLTRHEFKVLEQLQHGRANRAIAYDLQLSERAVKAHVRRLMKKLKAKRRTEVAFLAQPRQTEKSS